MKQQLEQRLKELRSEFESGKRALTELETKQMNLRNTLLRISGAIQVIEEELSRKNQPELENIALAGGFSNPEQIIE